MNFFLWLQVNLNFSWFGPHLHTGQLEQQMNGAIQICSKFFREIGPSRKWSARWLCVSDENHDPERRVMNGGEKEGGPADYLEKMRLMNCNWMEWPPLLRADWRPDSATFIFGQIFKNVSTCSGRNGRRFWWRPVTAILTFIGYRYASHLIGGLRPMKGNVTASNWLIDFFFFSSFILFYFFVVGSLIGYKLSA